MVRPLLFPLIALLLVVSACSGATDDPVISDADVQATPSSAVTVEPTPDPGPSPDAVASPDASSPAAEATEATAPTDEASPRTFEEACAGRDDEAFIEVLTPMPGDNVGDPFTITGCGNTFEANVVYRVEDADGATLVEDFTTMTCGNGCVGEFTVDVEVGAVGEVLLVVYEPSAEDGSEQHVVEVPLTIG